MFNGISNNVLYQRKGDQTGERFGAAVAVDGQQHLFVGAPLRDLTLAIDNKVVKRKDAGRVQVFTGASLSPFALLQLNGAAAGDNFGAAISAANDTWAIGAPLADSAGKDAGRVQIFVDLNPTVVVTLLGSHAGDHFGSALNLQGDVNSDGANDLAIGAAKFDLHKSKDAGRVEVLSGAAL